jgi:hypothetical protein
MPTQAMYHCLKQPTGPRASISPQKIKKCWMKMALQVENKIRRFGYLGTYNIDITNCAHNELNILYY